MGLQLLAEFGRHASPSQEGPPPYVRPPALQCARARAGLCSIICRPRMAPWHARSGLSATAVPLANITAKRSERPRRRALNPGGGSLVRSRWVRTYAPGLVGPKPRPSPACIHSSYSFTSPPRLLRYFDAERSRCPMSFSRRN
jgi:hypothetical protein